jgi:hypothetical protein
MRLWRNDGTFRAPAPDIHWTYNIPPGRPEREGVFAWAGHLPSNMQRKNNFACGKSDDVMTHGLEPFASAFPSVANLFVNLDDGRPVSATHALLAALVASYQGPGQERPAYLNLARVTAALALASTSTADHDYTVYLKTALGLLVSAVEHGAAPPSALQPLAETTHVASPDDARLTELVTRLHRLTHA